MRSAFVPPSFGFSDQLAALAAPSPVLMESFFTATAAPAFTSARLLVELVLVLGAKGWLPDFTASAPPLKRVSAFTSLRDLSDMALGVFM